MLHFEGLDKNAANQDAAISSQMKKNTKKLARFAKNEYFCTDEIEQNRARFSQKSLYEAIRFIICEIFQETITLVISGLQK